MILLDRPTKELLSGILALWMVVVMVQTIVYSYIRPSCKRKPPPAVNNATLLPTIHAVLCARIYAADPPKWSRHELEQWVQYMRYAGVSHVYLYDTRHTDAESLAAWAAKHGTSITYVDWLDHSIPWSVADTQNAAYQHALDTYGKASDWVVAFDLDEYPFAPNDLEPGFLQRAVAAYSDRVTEISLQNYVFLGAPCHGEGERVIERITRRSPAPLNDLVKPIYRPYGVAAAEVHHNVLNCGSQVDADGNKLRLNHYWGLRKQNWGKGCDAGSTRDGKLSLRNPLPPCLLDEQVKQITVEDIGAAYIARRLNEMH